MDTLTCNGVEKSFAGWNLHLDSISSVKTAGGADSFTATVLNKTLAAEVDAPTFPFESRIVVRTNRAADLTGGTIKFVGYCVSAPAKATAVRQGVTYQFRGPWYHLENCDYMQSYQGNNVLYFLPEIILNTSTAATNGWAQISVGDQLQAILQWVLDQYAQQGFEAPFQYKARVLNAGKIDLSQNVTAGTPGGDIGFNGKQYNFHLVAGLTIDISLFSLFLPTFIEKPMKCSRALQKCLELSPRVNVWFDYSTVDGTGNPLPTIRIDLTDTMPVVNLPILTGLVPGGQSNKAVDITPWQELSPRAVIIKYRITNTFNGVKKFDYVVDKWSASGSNVNLAGTGNNALDPNCGLRVINEILDLQGFSQTTLEGHLDLEPIFAIGGNQQKKRGWWASERGGEVAELKDTHVRFQKPAAPDDVLGFPIATEIPDAVITNATNSAVMSAANLIAAGLCDKAGNLVLNRLVRGTYHVWMTRPDGQPVVTMKVKISAKMSYAQYDCESAFTNVEPTYIADVDETGNQIHLYNSVDHTVNIEVTNASPDAGTSGEANFSTVGSSEQAETYIIGAGGIAQYVYNHLNAPQYVGDCVHVGANFADVTDPSYVSLGNKLNLTGGAALWQTMNAQIQEIREDWGAKETTVRIGVSKNLSAGQLWQMFNMWRYRRVWYNPNLRTDNAAAGSSEVDMAKSHGDANTAKGLADSAQQSITVYSSPPAGSTPGVIAAQMNNAPQKIVDILAAITTTPAATFTADDLKIMEPREIAVCDADGNRQYIIVHSTPPYTKS